MARSFALACALALPLAAAGCGGEPPVPEHVILVTIDTLRADRVGAYGYDKPITPALDALAAEGTVFENVSTTIPLTGPVHAGILTGRYPLVTGFRNNGSALLSPEEILLPEILKGAGFRTAAVVSCLVLASHFGFNQGFDLYYEDDITSGKGKGMWFEERKADKTVDRALRWMEAQKGHRVFLWMHLFDPHHPYDAPGADPNASVEDRYDAEVAFADEQLGRFFGALRAQGVYDEAMIVVAGDHGESLGEHGEMFHGIFVYQSTMHVPFIVRLPGVRGGRRVADQASILDITPTVLEALKLPPPDAQLQGVSLLAAARGAGRVPARIPYLESIYGSSSYGWAEVSAVRTPRYKYISLPKPELYDLQADPNESTNIVLTSPAEAEQARRRLDEVRGALQAVQRTDVEAASIDDEMRERLQSLGYISGTESKMRVGEARDPKDVIDAAEGVSFAGRLSGSGLREEAERVLDEVLRIDPENKMGLTRYARLMAGTGRLDRAVETMRRAIKIYPDQDEFYRTLGWMLIRHDRMDEAIELFSRGLETIQTGSMLYLYGYANFRAGRWADAEKALVDSLALNAREAKAHYLIGLCREKLGRRDEAFASFRSYLEMEPDVEELFRDPYLESFRRDPRFAGLVKRYL